MEQIDLLARTMPFVGILLGIEALAYLASRRRYEWREAACSFGVFVIGALIKPIFIVLPFLVTGYLYRHRLFTIEVHSVASIVFTFLTFEFLYYWQHRFGHTVRWFWASHSVHHTPMQLQLASAYRLSWTAAASGVWLFYMPMALIGFDPYALRVVVALTLLYQLPLHTEFVPKLGPLEWIFNTPSHHRVHHGCNPQYVDKNFGGILIIYDRLFGTFQEERTDVQIRYGVVGAERNFNPITLNFREWAAIYRQFRQSRGYRQSWNALFGKPGTEKATENPISIERPVVAAHTPADDLREAS